MVGSFGEVFPFVIAMLLGLLCVAAVNVECWRAVAVRSGARTVNGDVLSGFSRLIGDALTIDRLLAERLPKPVRVRATPSIAVCRRRV